MKNSCLRRKKSFNRLQNYYLFSITCSLLIEGFKKKNSKHFGFELVNHNNAYLFFLILNAFCSSVTLLLDLALYELYLATGNERIYFLRLEYKRKNNTGD